MKPINKDTSWHDASKELPDEYMPIIAVLNFNDIGDVHGIGYMAHSCDDEMFHIFCMILSERSFSWSDLVTRWRYYDGINS